MFILDSLLSGGIRWALDKAMTVAEAEMNDDSALRDRLMEAEMQREMGEITDAEFVELEADLLKAIREIKERREGGAGAFAFNAGQPIETDQDSRFQIEAEIAGDFYGDVGRSDRSDQPEPAAATPPPGPSASAEPRVVSRRKTARTPTRRTARPIRTTRRK